MPKGGKREGAGRKKLSESGRVKVQIAPQKEEIEFIDEQAKSAGMNRTRFVVECVKFYVENHK
jgi:uncharacterized protein (DUF1778 family)